MYEAPYILLSTQLSMSQGTFIDYLLPSKFKAKHQVG